MFARKHVLPLILITPILAACGTYVPEIQEVTGDPGQGQLLVQAIVQNVTCEIQNAVYDVINNDKNDVSTGKIKERHTAWLDNWGVQSTLTLTVDENTSVTPTISWLPSSMAKAVFSLAGGITVGADATRIAKVNGFYSVEKLQERRCAESSRPGGPFIMQNNLKLEEWLYDNVQVSDSGELTFPADPKGPLGQNVISQEVKFVVATNANITPGVKFKRVSLDPTGSLLSGGRVRTDDLLITLGPTQTNAQGQTVPSDAAAAAHLSSQIGAAVSAAITNGLLPMITTP
jgi:hypothetical protein